MIACLGETTGEGALQRILEHMKSSPEGLDILTECPRINTKTVNLEELRQLPENTFGRKYWEFLDKNVSDVIIDGKTSSQH
jgi:ubiquinone biosynthesis protein COQ4